MIFFKKKNKKVNYYLRGSTDRKKIEKKISIFTTSDIHKNSYIYSYIGRQEYKTEVSDRLPLNKIGVRGVNILHREIWLAI